MYEDAFAFIPDVSKQTKWHNTKMKCSIKDFFNKCDQIRIFGGIWSLLLKKSLMKNLIFVQGDVENCLIFCRTLKYFLEVVCCSFWCKLCKCKYKSVNIRSYSRKWFLKMSYHELFCKCSLWIICKFFLFAFIMEFLCNKAAGLRLAILLKRHFGTGVFLWILKNF